MSKVIVLGLNRSGTKLVSYLVAHACNMRHVYFEPFTWEGGVDITRQDSWWDQLRLRHPSSTGRQEHRRLPVLCKGDEESSWLANILCNQKWDLVKLIEIGRCKLYHALCPEALMVGLIRSPVAHLTSIKGTTIQKNAIIEQWQRLIKESYVVDPLPNADRWLPDGLADCARAYHFFYKFLLKNLPGHSVRVSYESLLEQQLGLKEIVLHLNTKVHGRIHAPMIGHSTERSLSDDQKKYVEDHLQSTYSSFLTTNKDAAV